MVNLNNFSKFVKFFLKKTTSKQQTNKLNVLLFSSFSIKSKIINYNNNNKSNSHDDIRYQHTSSTNTSNNKSGSSDFKSNSLTLGKSKHLMRLIYSRVHPDLFTNHEQAQVNYNNRYLVA